MDQKDLDFEQDLIDSELLLNNTARSMDDDAEYTLESILAEYGEDASSAAGADKEPKGADEPPAAAQAAEKAATSAAHRTVIPFPGAKKTE